MLARMVEASSMLLSKFPKTSLFQAMRANLRALNLPIIIAMGIDQTRVNHVIRTKLRK